MSRKKQQVHDVDGDMDAGNHHTPTRNSRLVDLLVQNQDRLVEQHTNLLEAIDRLTDLVDKKEKPTEETDPWVLSVKLLVGKNFPADIQDWGSGQLLLDERVACDPHLLILLIRNSDLKDWVENSVLPGESLRTWRGLVSREHVWAPRDRHGGSNDFFLRLIDRLQGVLQNVALAVHRWPANLSATQFFLENSTLIAEASNLAKELEGKCVGARLGPKAAAEFFQAYRLGTRRTGATVGQFLSKIKIGGKRQNRGSGAHDTADDSSSDDDEGGHGRRRGSKWRRRGGRGDRRGDRGDGGRGDGGRGDGGRGGGTPRGGGASPRGGGAANVSNP